MFWALCSTATSFTYCTGPGRPRNRVDCGDDRPCKGSQRGRSAIKEGPRSRKHEVSKEMAQKKCKDMQVDIEHATEDGEGVI